MARKHLYNSKLGKVRWFIRRFGAGEIFRKPFRVFFAPLIIRGLRPETFLFQGHELECFYHRYNMTWASERCVEVPIGRMYLSQAPPDLTLEVGNVLSHYGPVRHQILDKFEKGPGIMNEDITSFRSPKRYELILSISTFEHIGFDDEAEGQSAEKILSAIKLCRTLLSPAGRLVITVPMNYNPELDQLIAAGELRAERETFLKRYGAQLWKECPRREALNCRYKEPFPYANAIVVAEFGSAGPG